MFPGPGEYGSWPGTKNPTNAKILNNMLFLVDAENWLKNSKKQYELNMKLKS